MQLVDFAECSSQDRGIELFLERCYIFNQVSVLITNMLPASCPPTKPAHQFSWVLGGIQEQQQLAPLEPLISNAENLMADRLMCEYVHNFPEPQLLMHCVWPLEKLDLRAGGLF